MSVTGGAQLEGARILAQNERNVREHLSPGHIRSMLRKEYLEYEPTDLELVGHGS